MQYRTVVCHAVLCAMALAPVGADQNAVSEARGVWLQTEAEESDAAGTIVERLKDHAFNMVLAYYWPWDKDRLNRPPGAPANELDLRDLIAKAHAAGIEVHCWIFRPAVEGRPPWRCRGWDYQRGRPVESGYCLSEPAYLRACERQIKRLVGEYDWDGLHLDEVTWGLPWDACLCARCRDRFERETGINLEKFPEDVIRVDRITDANRGNPAEWQGTYWSEWVQWKCRLVADYIGRMAQAARSVRGITLSYAARSESWANPIYYSEDLSLIARHMDFMVPMTYFSEYSDYQERPERTGAWAKELAEAVWRGNPGCRVYGAVSTFSTSYAQPVTAVFNAAVAAGRITELDRERHLRLGNGWEARASMQWLRGAAAVAEGPWQEAYRQMEARLATASDVIAAVESVRGAGLDGIVFFPYRTMWADTSDAVVGQQELAAYLQQAFADPALPPHRTPRPKGR